MDGGNGEMVKAALRNGYLLLFFIIFSFVLNEAVIIGNDFLAEAADTMLSGQQVPFSDFLMPLFWLTLIGTAAAYLKSISGRHYSAVVQKEVRTSLEEQLLKLPFSYFDEKGTGNIMNRLISDIEEMGRFFSEILPELLVNLVIVLTVTVYLIQMDVRLIMILFISYPIMLVAADRLSKKLAELAKKRRIHMDERTEKAYDAIQGIAVSRSYNLYSLHKQKIDTIIDKMVEQTCESTKISSLGWVLKNILTTIPVIGCYLFALYEIRQNRITVGEMLAFTVLLSRILYPIGDIVFCINDIREAGVSLKRIQEIYHQQKERTDGIFYQNLENSETVPAIQWQDITFCYPGSQENLVLNQLSFSVKTGEQIAFVGGSGEGKSTIFKLLCGFYEKNQGEYNLFGHAIEDWNLKAVRKCFSEVSQNVFLFPGTIRQNVACGKEHATEKEIITACKNANIHDFIIQLPKGYDTLVGERGVLLSGGQRQRISIARAFLKDALILLFDEPTASVDIEAEQKIQDAIEKIAIGKTVITIAHRLSTIKNAHKIYVISKGKIAEIGNHQELLEKQGIYAEMYAKG